MKLAEEKKIVPVMASANIGAGVDADSINMKGFHRCAFIIIFGDLSGNATLKVHSGAADGQKASDLTFHYGLASAAIGSPNCDVLGADAASDALTLTADTYKNKMLIVEVDAANMNVANSEEWLTLSLSNEATSGSCNIVAILEPRYTGNRSATALA